MKLPIFKIILLWLFMWLIIFIAILIDHKKNKDIIIHQEEILNTNK